MIRKRFGQHFLTDRHALLRIVDALQLTGSETVVEIGPGKGALTDLLAERCAHLQCVEIDRDLAAFLRDRYRDRPHVEITAADVLSVDLGALAGRPYVLVGNLPYYLTTPIIFHALKTPRPMRSVFLVQREVAERLSAAPGTKAYGALSVNVQLVAAVETVGVVGAGAFFPRPTVESAMVRLTPFVAGQGSGMDQEALRAFVTGLFGQRRRQLPRALRTVTGLDAGTALAVVRGLALDEKCRAEELPPVQLARLFVAALDARNIVHAP